MLTNIPFKLKLMLLLITAVLGFITVTFVAMDGLSSQKNTSNDLRTLSKIQTSNDIIIINMLEMADNSRYISTQDYARFMDESQTKITENNDIIRLNIERALKPELTQVLQDSLTQMNEYSQALISLIEQRYIIGFDSSSGLRGSIDKMGSDISTDIDKLTLLKREFTNVRNAEASYLSDPTDSNLAEFMANFERFDNRVVNFGFQDTHGVKAYAYRDAIVQYGTEFLSLDLAEDTFAAQKSQFNDSQYEAHQLIETQLVQAEKAAENSSNRASATLLVVSLSIIVFATLLMFAIGRNVNLTLQGIITDLNKVKQGDMSSKAPVNTKRHDEFDQLSESLNEMTAGLGDVLKDVVSTTDHVSTMSIDLNNTIGRIASSNHLVNQRTHSLATATDDISGRLTELSNTTNTLRTQSNNTYQSAKSGADTIKTVLSSISDTVNIVTTTSHQLNELGRLSKNIDNVIAMINDLASQTNLLALNAAIEAARAGEAGRGFSVVADEVRALAEKTVDATSKITDIVNTIQQSTQTAISTMESGQDNLKIIGDNGSKAEEAMRNIENNAMTGSQSTDSMAAAIQEVASTALQMSAEMEQIAQQLNQDTGSIDVLADKTKQIQRLSAQLATKTNVFTLL